MSEAEQRIKSLEAELEEVKQDYSNLQTSYKKLQADRNMEVQIIQKVAYILLDTYEALLSLICNDIRSFLPGSGESSY